jgi:hypothetical protein
MSLAAIAHLAEGLFRNELFTMKVETFLICLVDTLTTSVQDGMAIYSALEDINNK